MLAKKNAQMTYKTATVFALISLCASQASANTYSTSYNYKNYASDGYIVKTDPNGQELKYHYDDFNNLQALELSSHNPVPRYEFKYDLTNQLDDISYTLGATEITRTDFSYDVLDRLSRVNEFGVSNLLEFGYDALHRLNWIKYPGENEAASAVCYAYDADGRLLTVGRIATGGTANAEQCLSHAETKLTSYAYEAGTGRLKTINYANGTRTEQSYYANTGQIESVGHYNGTNLIYKDIFTYYPNSHLYQNISRETLSETVSKTYSYDGYERLTEIIENKLGDPKDYITRYQYDAFGNRTYKFEIVQQDNVQQSYIETQYEYQLNSNRLHKLHTRSSASGAYTLLETLSYDAAGRITERTHASQGITRYNFDDRGLLTAVTLKADTVQANTTAYSYDALGIRKSKTVNGVTTYYVTANIFGFPRVLMEYQQGASAYTLGSAVASYVYGGSQQLIEESAGQQLFKLHDGIVGSVTHELNISGAVVNEYAYSAFGQQSMVNNGATGLKQYGYTGEEYDASTGLLYLRARYYDAELGRFISADPYWGRLDEPVSQNRYIYVHGNPLGFTDPSGLAANFVVQGLFGCGAGAFGGGAVASAKSDDWVDWVVGGVVGCVVGGATGLVNPAMAELAGASAAGALAITATVTTVGGYAGQVGSNITLDVINDQHIDPISNIDHFAVFGATSGKFIFDSVGLTAKTIPGAAALISGETAFTTLVASGFSSFGQFTDKFHGGACPVPGG